MLFGIGYDIHKLMEERRLIIGGVDIPFEKGLIGHSDADVLIHAIIDAMLGATANGDIGQLFPDDDPRFKGADSLHLLSIVGKLLREDGYIPKNIDSIIIAESPAMAPHILAMRGNIADAIGIDMTTISVKAKTNEGIDAIGRGEAIAAWAIAAVEKETA